MLTLSIIGAFTLVCIDQISRPAFNSQEPKPKKCGKCLDVMPKREVAEHCYHHFPEWTDERQVCKKGFLQVCKKGKGDAMGNPLFFCSRIAEMLNFC